MCYPSQGQKQSSDTCRFPNQQFLLCVLSMVIHLKFNYFPFFFNVRLCDRDRSVYVHIPCLADNFLNGQSDDFVFP